MYLETFVIFFHTFKGEPFFLFVLENKEVVCLSKQFLNVCPFSFRWVKKIHLSKFVSEPLEIGKYIIAITEQYEYTRKSHVKKPYLPRVVNEIVAIPP